ncbi:unnamed protein product [Larinioides sclopetarius]|uniref:Uncharacterized protein n=1 Tax=Larinioides sclopetarius TaxID=280406 RepID=A0AAV2AIM1_9ARAC
MNRKICTMLASLSVLLFLIVADISVAYAALEHNMESAENSEDNFYLDGVQRGYLKTLSNDPVLPYPVSNDGFQRQRKSNKKQCHILVQKTEMQEGQCTKLADNTPACHNEHFLAINYNEC